MDKNKVESGVSGQRLNNTSRGNASGASRDSGNDASCDSSNDASHDSDNDTSCGSDNDASCDSGASHNIEVGKRMCDGGGEGQDIERMW